MTKCPICGEDCNLGKMIWFDIGHAGQNGYAVHYTVEKLREDVALCQSYTNGEHTKDFYTLEEALEIGRALLRAVLDAAELQKAAKVVSK